MPSPTFLPDEFLSHLDMLNQIVLESGDKLEGNLFYHHQSVPGRESIADYFAQKRANYAAFCRAGKTLLEIGFNAGHSALLALASGVEYHGVDICIHPYSQPCAAYLKEKFGDRFHFYPGDSRKVLPQMLIEYPHLRFDLLHIDGYHSTEACAADTANAMKMGLKNAWILIDDTDMQNIRDYAEEQFKNGTILKDAPPGWVDVKPHMIGRVP